MKATELEHRWPKLKTRDQGSFSFESVALLNFQKSLGQNTMDTLNFGTACWVRKVNLARVNKHHEHDSSVSAYKVVSTPTRFTFLTQRAVPKFSVSMAFLPKLF